MTLDLAFTPTGRIVLRQNDGAPETRDGDSEGGPSNGRAGKLVEAFEACPAEGLFSLAAEPVDAPLAPSFAYWRDFAGRYLAELCHTPDGVDAPAPSIPPPTAEELATLLLDVPPMQGAEYVSAARLEQIWRDLDAWVGARVASDRKGLSGFLEARAPAWRQVGRVCFHLAENRRDPDFPFAFLATYAPSLAGAGRVRYQPLGNALEQYAGAKNKKALIKLLSPIQRACEASSLVRELVESGDVYQPLAWTPRQAYEFLKEIQVFEKAGILVRLPDWWKKRPRPRVGVRIGSTEPKGFDAKSMLDFNVRLTIGNEELSESEWRQLLAGEGGLVLLRGQWVEIDRDKLAETLDHWKRVEEQAAEGLSFIDGMRLLAGAPTDLGAEPTEEQEAREWSFVDAGDWLGKMLEDLRDPENLENASVPGDLRATLRPYQKTGVKWLSFLSSLGLGGCLADDMGLGKTIQVLALLLTLKKRRVGKPSLLVLPASLLANWKSEMSRFAPTLRARFVHPSQTAKDELARMAEDPARALTNVDVVLTTYGMLSRQRWLSEIAWRLVVLDEAQAIKNPGAGQTKIVKRLQSEARIALTGTPIENRVSDLWSLFDFLCPGLLGDRKTFARLVKALTERDHDRFAPLRRLVQPYILRRMKTDKRIISDLPEKTELRACCGLAKKQAVLYEKLVRELAKALKGLDGIKRRGLVLAYLMRFKQLCNHPSQLLGDGNYAPDESAKFIRLAELCEEIASRQEKALVFTQFREMTEPLASFLSGVFGRPGLVLHGGTPVAQRKIRIDEFQHDDRLPFFVLSLKAGGTGLNLTAASHVIHFDRWWNPAVENQATDRAFRIGQRRNVLVHKFVCLGTVEEKVDRLIEDKMALASNLLEGGADKLLTEMTDSELIGLVSLDIERARL